MNVRKHIHAEPLQDGNNEKQQVAVGSTLFYGRLEQLILFLTRSSFSTSANQGQETMKSDAK